MQLCSWFVDISWIVKINSYFAVFHSLFKDHDLKKMLENFYSYFINFPDKISDKVYLRKESLS